MKRYICLPAVALYSCIAQSAGLSSAARLMTTRSALISSHPGLNLQEALTYGRRSMASKPMSNAEIIQQDICAFDSPEELHDLAEKKLRVINAYTEARPALGLTFLKKSVLFGAKSVGYLMGCGLGSGVMGALIMEDANELIHLPIFALLFVVPVFKVGVAVGAYKCVKGTIRADEPDDKHLRAKKLYERILINPENMSRLITEHGAEDDYRGNTCLRITGELPYVIREHLRKKAEDDIFRA